ncbi:MAG: CoB--CoM heterodisulfide reductase iron-sulfur subunit A family protein [Elusimicrobia bacterium]|nr:CoB--CoM heterodisulfide reductase iron-sulfur subunit A family protein [Elusimicrobiota bacterium]
MAENKSILVVGGGISGISVAVEAAEVGYQVYLVEKNPYLGGRVAQLNKYFPKLCPPYCGLEINFRRIRPNPDIKVMTMSEVASVSGGPGSFTVTVKTAPRYVNDSCTACGKCAEACPAERSNDFNYGMDKTKAAYLPHIMAFPMRYVIDKSACASGCQACKDACKYGAVDLGQQAETTTLNVGSIVYATGWKPYDMGRLSLLGEGKIKNVISNVMMERLASPGGPTAGKILRPSDGKEAKNIAFVQCAGSRDENHLSQCSSICCMASIKQAFYLREQYEDSKVQIFYIDLRTPGRYEKFLKRAEADENITFMKGKVAQVSEDPATGDVTVTVEDILGGGKKHFTFDMVVLATGMEPVLKQAAGPQAALTEEGFAAAALQKPGIFSAGVAKSPVDVVTSIQDASGVALKAIQAIVRS